MSGWCRRRAFDGRGQRAAVSGLWLAGAAAPAVPSAAAWLASFRFCYRKLLLTVPNASAAHFSRRPACGSDALAACTSYLVPCVAGQGRREAGGPCAAQPAADSRASCDEAPPATLGAGHCALCDADTQATPCANPAEPAAGTATPLPAPRSDRATAQHRSGTLAPCGASVAQVVPAK
ncbi:hypothetical protein TARUN_2864 [Trichoderma arundinaceum]|uniref:Uncharacterized protein n=1 Tax=Trichoderma arundinaceum TaxID=490622 RepID=A0A395NTM1_TRIAR|nr:hypothetical protein TARUN_2864 [Trichoderma arundinaceum]